MTEIERLNDIVRKLCSEDGCPWDRVQTHESLEPACIEEAAEVISGINIFTETGDAENLKEELGDLLLQVVLHAAIAQKEGIFSFEDVAKTVADKMIRRHPHIFGDVTYVDEATRSATWEQIKKKEKEGREWQEEYLKKALQESAELIETAKKRKGF